jgi:hypothetical protein
MIEKVSPISTSMSTELSLPFIPWHGPQWIGSCPVVVWCGSSGGQFPVWVSAPTSHEVEGLVSSAELRQKDSVRMSRNRSVLNGPIFSQPRHPLLSQLSVPSFQKWV